MKSRNFRNIIFTILFLFLFLGISGMQQIHAQACPTADDIGFDDDKKRPGYAWSKSGVQGKGAGVNTWGGNLTCYCKLERGSTGYTCNSGGPRMVECVTRPDFEGKCYPGVDSIGAFAMGCNRRSGSNAVICPSPMPFNMRVQDSATGNGVPNLQLRVLYGQGYGGNPPGWSTIVTTDANGNASINDRIYSGMHVEVIPVQNQGYDFNPTRHGANIFTGGNWGDMEMNTDWSCGTPVLQDGTNAPEPVCVFRATPTCKQYSVMGSVYVDYDQNNVFSGGDRRLSNQRITIRQGNQSSTATTDNAGNYRIDRFCEGQSNLSYFPIATGYKVEYPKTGVPPTYSIRLGSPCSIDGTTGGFCAGGHIVNANFALVPYDPWFQSTCLNMRDDSGFDDPIPPGANCSGTTQPVAINTNNTCTNNPGVLYTGDSSADLDGQRASSKNFIAGGPPPNTTTYEPQYGGTLRTAYDYMNATARQSGITPFDLASVCTGGLNNCTLQANIPHGLYKANGNVTLNAYTYPANQNYVFLINGNLTINGRQLLSGGSTLTVAAAGDINVNPSVGGGNPDLEGLYSSDKNFFVNGTPRVCQIGSRDLPLTVRGSIVVNAKLQGGIFRNTRTLCDQNASCPAVNLTPRLDLVTRAPGFIKHSASLSKEIAP